MRVTNKMMQSNALTNLNTNKILKDKLNSQMLAESKIVRPSDDPVVAIRALRLRTDLSMVTQYHEKNIPDAKSWLELTEKAVDGTADIIAEMKNLFSQGVQDYNEPENRQNILENLKSLRDAVYISGDSDYAGRQLFTGYRTDKRLSFLQNETIPYKITEQINKELIDTTIYVEKGDLSAATGSTVQTDVSTNLVDRIRLSYDNLDSTVTPKIMIPKYDDPPTNSIPTLDADKNAVYEEMPGVTITPVSKDDDPSPYLNVPANEVRFVKETGELLLGKDVKNKLESLGKKEEIRIEYGKSEWAKGDLRPEHYFSCVSNEGAANELIYNPDYLKSSMEARNDTRQYIMYDVGFNQDMRVNTTANECYTHAIGRDVDEMIGYLDELIDMHGQADDLKTKISSGLYADTALEELKTRYEATDKALTYVADKVGKAFQNGLEKMQGHLDKAALALTNIGNRSSTLELIENRIETQKTSFTELKEENEGVDTTEILIKIESAEVAYEAALIATGKIVQNSLMNFI